ncbi:Eco57I restriction-modification methylase domain-containing protein [Salinibacter ruber]|uniref:Eco57I restriction-modification methylase domain-containing protein n=1 Tax=Salinibacter ruber TaxID=146919 RepID=UPI0020732DE1|nr:N-6 DNA methylase [Salinibacter ruber]
MSLDLTGIQSENEFYTTYYLQEVLEGKIKDEYSGWAGQTGGERSPDEVLGGLGGDYFQRQNQLLETESRSRRLQLQREALSPVLEALGYEMDPMLKKTRDGRWLPVLAQETRPDGGLQVCVVEAPPTEGEESPDPLEQTLTAEQFEGLRPEYASANDALEEIEVRKNRPLGTELGEVITKGLFGLDEPPRYVIVMSEDQILLLERSKWQQRQLLRFETGEILSRADKGTLKATVSLLHRESTCPEDAFSMIEEIDEDARSQAFGVSENLKYALREAIELLGNEAIWYIQNVRKEKTYDDLDEEQLTTECLRYMYRLLFLFYVEARPELGYAPMDSDEYLKGYSVEHLRDLEMIDLTTEESRSGFYIHRSLDRLFSMVFNGYPKHKANGQARGTNGQVQADFDTEGSGGEAGPDRHTFEIEPLRSHLFDPEQTPLLDGVKFRNETLQKVIRLMSLSDPEKRSSRERLSYAALGIGQLGAVYEGLLSYSGFFAEEDLYEVKEAGESRDLLDVAYFVGEEELEDYSEEEIVFDEDGRPLRHEKGTFLYRLAGREREESASYYTPKSLTECLVKYSLKELIGEDSSDMEADEILDLTVCEPAMGSGAFLNEAVDQLAEAYLQRKQEENGERISHEKYGREKQKVKMYLADNNVFGVDLNPVATELAEVSLWLNTIYEQKPEDAEYGEDSPAFVPWFGMQLETGNSLIGARRETYAPDLLTDSGGRGKPPWMETPPERVEPGEERTEGDVYHFLVPDYEMASYSTSGGPGDLAEEEIKSLRSWRRGLKNEFDQEGLQALQSLSEAVDGLWEKHARQQRRIREQTTDPIHVWGQPEPDSMRPPTTTRWKDEKWHTEMHSEGRRMSSPYRRLKLVMDYWCALWFWPIEKHGKAPTRQEWLMDLQMILEGDLYETQTTAGEQQALFESMEPEAKQLAMELKDEHGFVNVDKLCDRNPRLGIASELADRYKFFHWELEYADLFKRRGGFDLTIGNPPWVKIRWDDEGVLSEAEPKIEVRDWSKTERNRYREGIVEENHLREEYLAAYEADEATQNFLNAQQNYPRLKGGQANTYKCFIPQAWKIGQDSGVTGFLHPDGIYDDPGGGGFRKSVYPRLRRHYHFWNALFLFEDVHDQTEFSVNIYQNSPQESVQFLNIANLYTPSTIEACLNHDGSGSTPGKRDENHDWNTEGHADRVVMVDDEALRLFATLYDGEDTAVREARLSVVHSQQILEVLRRFANQPKRLGDLKGEYKSTVMFDETYAQEDGTIERDTQFIDNVKNWVLSGPHFFVATPFYKTPREGCNNNQDYDELALTSIPADYLPRTNYVPACSHIEYRRRTPTVPWENENGECEPVTQFYRFGNREMIGPSSVRTFVPTVIPPGVGHINTTLGTAFKKTGRMLDYLCMAISVPVDFRVKSTGMTHANTTLINQLPVLPEDSELREEMHVRALLLNSLTTHYADLWEERWQDSFHDDTWLKDDPRLNAETDFSNLTGTWDWDTPLRTRYARRQARVELDVLAAKALSLTLEELQTIYRVQFGVLRKWEENTWYDQNGRIIYTRNSGLPGVGFKSRKWKKVKDMESGTVEQKVEDNTQPGGPTERTIVYEAPFTKCDREEDYKRAWEAFENRKSTAGQ